MVTKTKEILIVDDDPFIRDVLRRSLSSKGYGVVATERGSGVLALALERRPDAILMDIGMAGMDGLEACRALRVAGLRIPVVFLTAKAFPEDRRKGLEAGAAAYLTKPFDVGDLLQTVKQVLGG